MLKYFKEKEALWHVKRGSDKSVGNDMDKKALLRELWKGRTVCGYLSPATLSLECAP